MNIDEGGGGPPTAAIGGGAAVAILLMVGLGFLYLRKKRMAGSQSPVALTAISLTPTKEKDLESGAPATKGPAASGKTTTYSVELTKTPKGLGLVLSGNVVTEVKPDSQAARGGRIMVGYRRLTLTLTLTLTLALTLTLTLTLTSPAWATCLARWRSTWRPRALGSCALSARPPSPRTTRRRPASPRRSCAPRAR